MKEKLRSIRAGKYVVFAGVTGAVLLLIVLLVFWHRKPEDHLPEDTQDTETFMPVEEIGTEATEENTELPEETEEISEFLQELNELHAENADLIGWIRIEDTVIDYPVMHTPSDSEKYIYKNFDGIFDVNGLPFLDGKCSLDPESTNLIIYGHNMKSGAMFASLLNYKEQEYWEEHPVISFSTLNEEREYEVLAAFYDKVYYKTDTCFKFYQFIDAEDAETYREAITYYKEHGLYDTGVTAEYGDRLITLVTCAYHVENGRFVVVAREILDPAESEPTAETK